MFDGFTEYTAAFLGLEMCFNLLADLFLSSRINPPFFFRICEGTLGLDVQYVHGLILEQMAKLKSGGSSSALCLIENSLVGIQSTTCKIKS